MTKSLFSVFQEVHIDMNDLNGVVNFSKNHHFADDTNILYASNSLKDKQKD